MIDAAVLEAVEGLQGLVEADGGAFELLDFDASSGVLRLQLRLDRVTCQECILPPDMVKQVVDDFVRRSAAQVVRVELDDPRSVHQ